MNLKMNMDDQQRCTEIGKLMTMDIHILLVDDDATSLAVVSAMLRLCKYKVVTLKNPIEALDTLRARKGFFDLVVTDLHMPQMNGLQLQKQVVQEFKLPVIMMSADEKPSVILKSLEEGVAFYMVKPISLDDVKHVWQYAITAKKLITPSNQTTTTNIIRRPRELSIEKSSSSSTTPCSKEAKLFKNKKKAKENRVTKNSIAIRSKAKVIWTNSLHNRFLQAIRAIGLDKAVPKKILEFMNVPGLTRENVASHLQKYRIFLKRVAEKGVRSMKIYSDLTLQRSSNFGSPHDFQHPHYYNFPQNHQLMCSKLNYQYCPTTLGPNNSMQNSLPHLGNNLKYSSLLTINKSNFPNFNHELVSSSTTYHNQNFVLMGNESSRCSSNDGMICSGQLAPHDDHVKINGGLSFNIGAFGSSGDQALLFVGNFEDKNVEENNGSAVLVSSSEEEVNNNNVINSNYWKAAKDETIGIGDINNGDQHQNCFDVLSDIFMGHNHNQPSYLQKEEMDVCDIWNGIEMDASAKQDDHFQPSTLSAQGWDDDILEIFFGDDSS